LRAITWSSTMPYGRKMTYVVLCGPLQGPPDLVVGPFDSHEDAIEYAVTEPGEQGGRYEVVMPLTSPESS
jgi:hypothetical protein